MAEMEHILEALNAYQGDTDTLNAFIQAAETDLGADWPQSILKLASEMDAPMADKLNHAYNYYAATAAWNEIQGYLVDENPDVAVITERLPTLEHWLAFFGDAGFEPVKQLRERFNLTAEPIVQPQDADLILSEETPVPEAQAQGEAEFDFSNKSADELRAIADELLGIERIEKPMEMVTEKQETTEAFQVRQAFQDIDFLDRVQAWTAARCVELGNIEVYAYKFYGFQVDVMEHAKREIAKILESPALYPLVEEEREQGLTYLRNKLSSLEADLKVAYDNAQTDISPLVDDDMDAQQARALLGGLDTSNAKEFLGPAPDGFEMIDDPYTQIDEAQVTQAYNKLEEKVSASLDNRTASQQPTAAQSAGSGQPARKMSFSLGGKTAKPKPAGTEG